MLAEKFKKKDQGAGMMGRGYEFGSGDMTPGYQVEIDIEPAEHEMGEEPEDTSGSALAEIYPASGDPMASGDQMSLEEKMRKRPPSSGPGMML